jgi:hypothetical protein
MGTDVVDAGTHLCGVSTGREAGFATSVKIEKLAGPGSQVESEFLDLNHTGNRMILVSF